MTRRQKRCDRNKWRCRSEPNLSAPVSSSAKEALVNEIIYLIGLIVVVIALLNILGLR